LWAANHASEEYTAEAVTHRALLLLERLFIEGDEATRDLIGIGFLASISATAKRVLKVYSGPRITA